jgi:hypothetical protein
MRVIGLENKDAHYVMALETEEGERLYIRISGDEMRNIYAAQQRETEWSAQVPVSETPEGQVRAFAAYILHGDNRHRAWLLEAAEAFIASRVTRSRPGSHGNQKNSRTTTHPEPTLKEKT